MAKRVFIVDPVCAMTFGHTLSQLNYFGEIANNYCEEVILMASAQLPDLIDKQHCSEEIQRFFMYNYDGFMDIGRSAGFAGRTHSEILAAAISEFTGFLHEYRVDCDDALVFPSVDYYSLLSSSIALSGLEPQFRPKLMYRFIGVLENACFAGGDPGAGLEAVTALKNQEFECRLVAETPRLAHHLGNYFRGSVGTVPYPAAGECLPASTEGSFTILCGGSAREDKGFFRLLSIVTGVNKILPSDKVRFLIQNLPDNQQAEHLKYISQLAALPNVELLPGQISYKKILESYEKSDLVLLPYDRGTYLQRGSAMLMESMIFGRYVIGQCGTAFSDQILQYDAGVLCDEDDDYAHAIAILYSKGRRELHEKSVLAAKLYRTDVMERFNKWFGGV